MVKKLYECHKVLLLFCMNFFVLLLWTHHYTLGFGGGTQSHARSAWANHGQPSYGYAECCEDQQVPHCPGISLHGERGGRQVEGASGMCMDEDRDGDRDVDRIQAFVHFCPKPSLCFDSPKQQQQQDE